MKIFLTIAIILLGILLLGSSTDNCINDPIIYCDGIKQACYHDCKELEYTGRDNATCRKYCRDIQKQCEQLQ